MAEGWAPVQVPGYEHYEASTHGRIRNSRNGRVLAQYRNHAGYVRATLWKDGKAATKRVHRLVASAFLRTWDPALTVDHIDTVRDNNVLENLRMATQSQQARNVGSKRAKPYRIPVEQWTADGLVATHECLSAAARAVGARDARDIRRCLLGEAALAHGFVWRQPVHASLPGEVWEAYTATVLVSNKGRYCRLYRSGLRGPPKRASDMAKMDGYPYFGLGSGKGNVALHIAVARLFLEPPDDPAKVLVNHKDGNRENADCENLDWVTRSENAQHAHDTGLVRRKKAVEQYTLDGTLVARYPSIKAATAAAGCSRRPISDCIRGRAQSAGGFVWKATAS